MLVLVMTEGAVKKGEMECDARGQIGIGTHIVGNHESWGMRATRGTLGGCTAMVPIVGTEWGTRRVRVVIDKWYPS